MRSKPVIMCFLLMFCMSFLGCFTSDNPANESATDTTDRVLGVDGNSQISIFTSQSRVKTDNSDNATITVSVVDLNNSVMEGVTVSFSASSGQLSAANALTNQDGQASVTFSCGTIDMSNRVVTIEAAVEGLEARQIPIQIVGTTIDVVSNGTTSLSIDGDNTDTVTITVKDAGGNPIYDAPVSISLSTASTGSITFSPESGNTAVSGNIDAVVTAASTGIATLNISALGTVSTIDYTVTSINDTFTIQSPTDSIVSLFTNEALTVTVFNPSSGPSNTVVFATSFGSWSGGVQVVEVPLTSSNTASAVFQSTASGVATIQVYDKDSPAITDKLSVAISAPSSEASLVNIQSDYSIMPPSIGGTENEVALVVTVTTSDGQVVGGSPVLFSLGNTTGGGEFVYPTIAFTDNFGVARAKFTSGTKSSDAAGVKIIASLVDNQAITDDTNIIIGGTAASLVIGRATNAILGGGGTSYTDPMSLLVSDSNGNPMSGAVISLKIWPISYAIGDSGDFPDHDSGDIFENEDRNRNLILDPSEDKDIFGMITDPNHGDGKLTPANSTAGSLPATVITDESGLATFNLVYLKDYAFWVKVEVEASTIVMGTSAKTTLCFWLPTEKDWIYLPDSPFNP